MNIIKSELYKLKKDKLFFCIIIYLFLAILACSSMEIELGDVSGKIKLDYVFRVLNCPELFLIYSYIIIIYSIKSISDFSSGYIRDILSFGISRKKTWAYKSLFFGFSSTCICLVIVLTLSIGAVFLGGGVTSDFDIIQYIIIFLLTMMVCISFSFFMSAINFCFSSIKILVAIILATNVLIQTPAMLGHGTQVIKFTIFGALLYVYNGNLYLNDVLRIVFVCAYTCILSYVICRITFMKKDYER